MVVSRRFYQTIGTACLVVFASCAVMVTNGSAKPVHHRAHHKSQHGHKHKRKRHHQKRSKCTVITVVNGKKSTARGKCPVKKAIPVNAPEASEEIAIVFPEVREIGMCLMHDEERHEECNVPLPQIPVSDPPEDPCAVKICYSPAPEEGEYREPVTGPKG